MIEWFFKVKMLLCTTHPDMSSVFSHLYLALWLCQNLALPKSSLLRILASLSLYLEVRRNSFSSDQHNPLPANLHQHRPSDISTSLFHTFFFLLHNIYFQLIATFHVGPRWLLISFPHSPFLPLSPFLLRLIYLIICNALQPC